MEVIIIGIGLIGLPLVFLVMPIRLLIQLYILVKPPIHYCIKKGKFSISICLKILAITSVLYIFRLLASAGPGSSGLLIAYYNFFPLMLYIASEIFDRLSIKKQNNVDEYNN